MKKTLLIILVILIIVAGGIWYYLNCESDETANWKTYRNEEYGFGIKYPDNFSLKENSFVDLNTMSISLDGPKLQGIIIVNNPGLGGTSTINNSKIRINIEGIAAEYTIGDDNPEMYGSNITGKTIELIFDQNEDEYSVVFHFDKSNPEQEQLVKDILSTFKFIE